MAAYTVTHTDGTAFTVVGEGVADTTLGISLIGQNYHNYGQLMANNFLHLLENQSNATQPLNPQQGQLWWNSTSKVLSVFDGSRFKPVSSSNVGTNTPIQPKEGDQWWDTNTNQLKVYDTDAWITVGPLYQKGQLFSGILPSVVADNNGVLHTIATIQLDGDTTMIVSKDPTFYLPVGHEIKTLSTINPGLTLTPNTSITGTTLNANQLGGIPASQYLTTTATSQVLNGSLAVNGSSGLTIGSGSSLSITKDPAGDFSITGITNSVSLASGAASITCDHATGSITVSNEPTLPKSVATKFYVDTITSTLNSALRSYIDDISTTVTDGSPIPTLRALSAAIGNDPNYAANMNAALNFKAPINNPTLTGTPRAPTPAVGDSSTKIATTEFVQRLFDPLASTNGLTVTGDIIPTVDHAFNVGSPSYRFKTLYGNAMTANYADLAEVYTSDAVYRPGTVVVFGGIAEVTISDQLGDTRIAGVISTNPAYLMNDGSKGQAVALSGKVPCKVVGAVKKGDVLINSKFAGVATSLGNNTWAPGCTIGKSLEDDAATGIRDVMVAVGRF